MKSRERKAFTLIELLIVISIIGILSAITLTAILSAREKARDAERIATLGSLGTAIASYAAINGSLPTPSSYGRANSSPGWFNGLWDLSTNASGIGGEQFLQFLVTEGLTSVVPADPINTPANFNGNPHKNNDVHGLFYGHFPAGSYPSICGGDETYFIGISTVEHSSTLEKSPGCPCASWSGIPQWFDAQFDYLTCSTL